MQSSCRLPYLLLFVVIVLSTTGCAKKIETVEGKAYVEFRGDPHYEETRTGWLWASGYVINRGTKRADWVKVTIYTRDRETGVIIDSISAYVNGSGPNGKSVGPGETASYRVKLNAKKSYPYTYERKVTWSEPL